MQKILISMIGLGFVPFGSKDGIGSYNEACYQLSGAETTTPYHQIPLIAHLKPDTFWLVGTKEAKKSHAKNIEHQAFLEIPKGENDQQFWEIFNTLTQELDKLKASEEKVEIYLDLTHGFRVQPVFLLSAVRYYCQLHSEMFSIKDIYYSMYERDQEKHPILAVTPILEMERIASEVRAFLEHGSSTALANRLSKMETAIKTKLRLSLAELPKKEFGPAFKTASENHPILKHFKIRHELDKFGDLIGLNYTPGAAENIRRLCEMAEEASENFTGDMLPLAQAFSKLAAELDAFFPPGPKPLWKWHAAIARWCLERNFTQQALTHANELLTTRWCEENGLDELNYENRTKLGPLVYQGKAKPKDSLCKAWRNVVNANTSLGDARNAVNHAFCRETQQDISKFATGVRSKVEKLLALHQQLEKLPKLSTGQI